MERQYDKIIRLLKETTDKFKELTENLKGEQQHEITPEEANTLQLELLRFTVTIKEFGK